MATTSPDCSRTRQPRNVAQRPASLDGVRDPRHRPLPVVQNHGIDGILEEGVRIRGRGVAADDDGHAGARWRTRRASSITSSVSSACMAAIPTRPSASGAQLLLERSAESQIGERHVWPLRFERRSDVLHAERLDAEERAQPEALVSGHRTQQQDVHGSAAKRNIGRGRRHAARPHSTVCELTDSQLLPWSRRHRAVVLLGAACLAAASAAGMRGLTFDTDVSAFLPRDGRAVPAFRTFVASFGSVDDLYVVLTAPAGHAISDYEDDVEAWSDRLENAPEIGRVDAGVWTTRAI